MMKAGGAETGLDRRLFALMVILALPLVLLFAAVGPIPQTPAYHELADERSLYGVPNFFNVVSNATFLVVGAIALYLCSKRAVPGAVLSWKVFFVGVLLVTFGSAYYHLQPNDARLVWDRLPMTVAFTALFSALVAEHITSVTERTVLPLALAVGISSVAWWHYWDDLRLYAWVQFGPLVALLYLMCAYPARYVHRGYLALGFGCYATAKVLEHADAEIFSVTSGAVSGHTLKHVIAALAPLCVYLMLKARSSAAP